MQICGVRTVEEAMLLRLHVPVPKTSPYKQVLGIVTPLHSAGPHFLPLHADSQDPVAILGWTSALLEVADRCSCV